MDKGGNPGWKVRGEKNEFLCLEFKWHSACRIFSEVLTFSKQFFTEIVQLLQVCAARWSLLQGCLLLKGTARTLLYQSLLH